MKRHEQKHRPVVSFAIPVSVVKVVSSAPSIE